MSRVVNTARLCGLECILTTTSTPRHHRRWCISTSLNILCSPHCYRTYITHYGSSNRFRQLGAPSSSSHRDLARQCTTTSRVIDMSQPQASTPGAFRLLASSTHLSLEASMRPQVHLGLTCRRRASTSSTNATTRAPQLRTSSTHHPHILTS